MPQRRGQGWFGLGDMFGSMWGSLKVVKEMAEGC
jgi:hypothetical protein